MKSHESGTTELHSEVVVLGSFRSANHSAANASFQECRPSQFRPSPTVARPRKRVPVQGQKKKSNSNGKLVIECLRAHETSCGFQRRVRDSQTREFHLGNHATPNQRIRSQLTDKLLMKPNVRSSVFYSFFFYHEGIGVKTRSRNLRPRTVETAILHSDRTTEEN